MKARRRRLEVHWNRQLPAVTRKEAPVAASCGPQGQASRLGGRPVVGRCWLIRSLLRPVERQLGGAKCCEVAGAGAGSGCFGEVGVDAGEVDGGAG